MGDKFLGGKLTPMIKVEGRERNVVCFPELNNKVGQEIATGTLYFRYRFEDVIEKFAKKLPVHQKLLSSPAF